MFREITSETHLKKGDWVREKSTGKISQIGNLIDGKYELKPDGKSTIIRSRMAFVAERNWLEKTYEIQINEL